MSELAPGTVTIADLYREIVGMRADVREALTRVSVIDSRNTVTDALHMDHETRLRSLESFRWKLTGASMILSLFAGTVSGILASHIH